MSFFTNENFFEVFYYMEGYIEIDKSSKLGECYVQSTAFFYVIYLGSLPERSHNESQEPDIYDCRPLRCRDGAH